MITFDPLLLLFWIVLISFIPGVIISFSIFRKTELWLIEKIIIGCGLGLVLLSCIPFVFFLLGIFYSYEIAIVSVVLFYVVAIGIFILSYGIYSISIKTHEDFKLNEMLAKIKTSAKREWIKYAISIILLVILYLAFLVRVQTYSPIHYELDPYYYMYSAHQILTLGSSQLEDNMAWWPEVKTGHRNIPALAYMEALWYSFYTQGGEYNNYLLAVISSIYPPLAATFAVFFLYLFIAAQYRREYALAAAGIASFTPIFIHKLFAGVSEVQPYAFFTLAFFLAMYAWAIRTKSKKMAVVAGIAYAALALGSGSEVLAISVLIIFIPLQSILLFFKSKESKDIFDFVMLNAIIIAIGPVISDFILLGIYQNTFSFANLIAPLSVLVFSAIAYLVKNKTEEKKFDRETAIYVFIGIIIISVIVIAFTPLGSYVKGLAVSGLGIAKYTVPLHKTIAEQPPAGNEFVDNLGFMAFVLNSEDKTLGAQIIRPLIDQLSGLSNTILFLIYSVLNTIFDVGLVYDGKTASLLLVIILLSIVAIIYSFYRTIKNEPTIIALYVAILFPTMLVGLLKLKYVIYLGFFTAGMIGVILGEFEIALQGVIRRMISNEEQRKQARNYLFIFLVVIAAVFLIMQLSSNKLATIMISTSTSQKFGDDPSLFKEKFTTLCNQFKTHGISETELCKAYAGYGMCSGYDEDICTIAKDPVAYANKGINEQYNRKACFYSIITNPLDPKGDEINAAILRCRGIDGYWIETMEWIRNNTEKHARITSWWDYGHWINFFGQQNAVLRNEHSSTKMIGEVATGYLDDSPEEFAAWMRKHGSKYALFDVEINGLQGGKYNALNYLSCANMNKTTVENNPGSSQCESEHLWETIQISNDPCIISETANKTGVIAYKTYIDIYKQGPLEKPIFVGTLYSPSYLGDCINPTSQNAITFCKIAVKMVPTYCIGKAMLVNGDYTYTTYHLNETYPNGDLKLNKAIFFAINQIQGTYHFGDIIQATLVYTKDKIWLENGEVKDGLEDRSTKYYESLIYRAFFLEDLPGFKLVFKSKDGNVKIFKLLN